MSKLFKSALGQWKLIKSSVSPNGQWEILEKAIWEHAPHITKQNGCSCGTNNDMHHYSCVDKHASLAPVFGPEHPVNKHITGLFGKLNGATKAGNQQAINAYKGDIRSYSLGLPKGSLDIGHLGKLREASAKNGATRPIAHHELAEIINHHVGDVKSLKDLHQKNGGDAALETVMRTMGANGHPEEYSHMKFKNPGVHADILDLVQPGKGGEDRKLHGLPPADFTSTPNDPNLDSDVDRTYDDMSGSWDGEEGTHDSNLEKLHENAVVKRGVERFKRHHKL